MSRLIQAAVNCDVPGARTVTYNGGSSGFVTVSGYLVGVDYLAAITTALQAAGVDYAWEYNATTDRVVSRKNSGSNYGFDIESATMRDLIGWAGENDWTTPAASHTSVYTPHVIVPIFGAKLTGSASARTVTRRDYAPRRARHIAWGTGEIHSLDVECSLAAAERITAGPCMGGRVRIGESTASGALSASVTDGWVEGTVREVKRSRTGGPTEAKCNISYTIHHEAKTATPADFDAVFGSLARNYALVAYCRIEGIPYTFTERALQLTSTTHPESDTLILGDDTGLRYSIDRAKGAAGCGDLRIGILDPDNALELFGPPTLRAELSSSLAFDATAVAVDSTTSWGSSGALWFGKERIVYGSKTGSQFQTLTRGSWGPQYGFRVDAPLSWNICTDVPVFWQGRLVELWVALVDCYGRPVSTAWDDAYTRMMWSGAIRSLPAYEAGAWVIDCDSLAERMSREPGAELLGQSDVYALSGASEGPLCIVSEDAEVEYRLTDGDSPVNQTSGRVAMSSLTFGGSEGGITGYFAVSYQRIVAAVINYARQQWQSNGLQANDVQPYCVGAAKGEDGIWRAVIQAAAAGTNAGDGIWELGPISDANGLYPEWSKRIIITEESLPFTYTGATNGSFGWNTGLFDTGLDGRGSSSAVLRSPDDSEALTSGEWPTSGGFLTISGTDGDEVASYEGARNANGRTYLWGLRRGLSSTERADITVPGTEVTGYAEFTGTLGEQIATLLESSGYGDRGTYDDESAGYGLPDDYIDEDSILAAGSGIRSTAAVDLSTSLVDTYGGALASLGLSLAPVRDAATQRLRWGVRSVDPFGAPDGTIVDADLRADRIPQLPANGLRPVPNVVRLTPAELGGVQYGAVRVVLAESVASDGLREEEYALPWTDSPLGALMLQAQAQQTVALRSSALAYTLPVGPHKDWQPGQIREADLSHPALFDVATGQPGLAAKGVILEVSRTMSGNCSITLLVGNGDINAGPLCPSARVTAVNVGAKTITVQVATMPDGRAIFEDGSDVKIYDAGVASRYDEEQVVSVSGNVLTMNAFPAWLDATAVSGGGVYVTYPSEGSTNATALQDSHVHTGDGSEWL